MRSYWKYRADAMTEPTIIYTAEYEWLNSLIMDKALSGHTDCTRVVWFKI